MLFALLLAAQVSSPLPPHWNDCSSVTWDGPCRDAGECCDWVHEGNAEVRSHKWPHPCSMIDSSGACVKDEITIKMINSSIESDLDRAYAICRKHFNPNPPYPTSSSRLDESYPPDWQDCFAVTAKWSNAQIAASRQAQQDAADHALVHRVATGH